MNVSIEIQGLPLSAKITIMHDEDVGAWWKVEIDEFVQDNTLEGGHWKQVLHDELTTPEQVAYLLKTKFDETMDSAKMCRQLEALWAFQVAMIKIGDPIPIER